MVSNKTQQRYLKVDPEIRACKSKMVYPDQKQANRAAKEIQRKDPHKRIQAYRCRYCGYYHVGRSERVRRSLDGVLIIPIGTTMRVRRQMEAQVEEAQTSDPFQSDQE